MPQRRKFSIKKKEAEAGRAKFILPKEHNSALLENKTAHADQFRARFELEFVEMSEEELEETEEVENEKEQNLEESGNDVTDLKD